MTREGRMKVMVELSGDRFPGEVLHIPCDVGDMWQIKDDKGMVHYVNPISSALEQIVELPEPKAQQLSPSARSGGGEDGLQTDNHKISERK
jgi:hypothetical protein